MPTLLADTGATYTLLVPRVLALVWAGRRGLLERELLGILDMQPEESVPQASIVSS